MQTRLDKHVHPRYIADAKTQRRSRCSIREKGGRAFTKGGDAYKNGPAVKARWWMKSQLLNEFAEGGEERRWRNWGRRRLNCARISSLPPSERGLSYCTVKREGERVGQSQERVRDHYTELALEFAYIARDRDEIEGGRCGTRISACL